MLPGARHFLIGIPLILVTATGGVFGWWMAERSDGRGGMATGQEGEVLQSASMAYAALERERYRRLQVEARALADDPSVVRFATILNQPVEGEPPGDRVEIEARLTQVGADFAAVLDPAGQVLASSDLGAGSPPVASVPGDGSRRDLWSHEGRLFLTVTVPISPPFALPDAPLPGQVVVAEAVDSFLAREIRQISGGDVAFMVQEAGVPTVVASNVEDPRIWSQALTAGSGAELLRTASGEGGVADGGPVELNGESHRLRVVPLGQPTAAFMVVAVPRSVLAASWWPLGGLAGGSLVALLLAFPLAWMVGSGAGSDDGSPTLAAWLEQVRSGEASIRELPASAETRPESPAGRLAASLAALVGDVEQERALHGLLAAARDPSREGAGMPAPERRPATLLAVELRRYARAIDPGEAVQDLQGDLEMLGRAATARGGRVEGMVGHRVLVSFPGEEGPRHGLAAAVEVVEELARGSSPFDEEEPPPVALATGRWVTGSVVTAEGPRAVWLGLPAQLLETVLREAAPGQIFFSRDVHRALADDLKRCGLEPAPQQGILTTQPLYGLTPEQARQLVGELRTDDEEADAAAPGAGLVPGSLFADRFEVRSREEEGPLADNYRALDRELDQEVLLKVFRLGALETDRLEDLDSPVQPYRSFSHGHVARLFDFGVSEGRAFVARRWVSGVHLGQLLKKVAHPDPHAALAASRQLAAALAAAHGRGLVHLRLKPTNLLFDLEGDGVQVTDFGLASVVAGGEAGGKVGWAAPEQAEDGPGDPRSDVYTCGLLMHRLFVGAEGEGALPAEVAPIVGRCRAANPDERFHHGGELLEALEAVRL